MFDAQTLSWSFLGILLAGISYLIGLGLRQVLPFGGSEASSHDTSQSE